MDRIIAWWRSLGTWGKVVVVAIPLIVLAYVVDSSGDGSGGGPDVGAELACKQIRDSYDDIITDPVGNAGQLGRLIGAAGRARDAGIRQAAEEFDREPSAQPIRDIRARCEALGLALRRP